VTEMVRKSTRRLIADGDIHDAAMWRLAGFQPDAIEAATARVERLIASGIPLDSERPEVAAALASLERPGDRRNAWSALMAVVALWADAHCNERLFLLSGFEVVTAWRNGQTKSTGMPKGLLSEMMVQYRANQPGASADDLFDRLAGMAGIDPMIVDYDAERDVLTYEDRGRLHDVSRASFGRQFRRAQPRETAPTLPTLPTFTDLQCRAASDKG